MHLEWTFRPGQFRTWPRATWAKRSDADRVPDGLQLEERRDVPALCPSAWPRTTRLTLSAAARSRSAPRPSAPVRSIAFTSMCAASHGAELGAVAGQEVDDAAGHVGGREHLGELDRGERAASPRRPRRPRCRRRSPARSARRARGAAARPARAMPTTPVGSGTVKLKYGPATGFARAEHLRELVGDQPAYQTQRSIAPLDLLPAGARARRARPRAPPSSRRSGRAPGRGCRPSRPPTSRCAARGGLHRVAQVLARGAGDVLTLRLVGAPGLGARERAADVELVRLLDGEPVSHPRSGRRRRGTARARAGRPRGRSRTPCSRRTAKPGRSG